MALDDLLDVRELVPVHDREQEGIAAQALVLRPVESNLLGAFEVPALADQLQRLGFGPERLGELLELLVDLPEQRLVEADAPRALGAGQRRSRSRSCSAASTDRRGLLLPYDLEGDVVGAPA